MAMPPLGHVIKSVIIIVYLSNITVPINSQGKMQLLLRNSQEHTGINLANSAFGSCPPTVLNSLDRLESLSPFCPLAPAATFLFKVGPK